MTVHFFKHPFKSFGEKITFEYFGKKDRVFSNFLYKKLQTLDFS